MTSRVVVVRVLALIAAAAALLWPAFYNQQPFFFPDTTAYVRGADAAMVKLTGVPSAWTQHPQAQTGTDVVLAAVTPDRVAPNEIVPDKVVLAGRSIYYGALVYLGDRVGGEWLTIVIQALLVVLALYGMLQRFELGRWQYLLLLVSGLAAFTLLPLYVSFLMPDVFTGLTILACAMLLTCDLGEGGALTLAWFALLTASLTFHTTHSILAFLMFGLGLVLYVWRQAWVVPRGLVTVAAAVITAYLCGTAFTVGVTKLLGEPPLTPPFLMARLIDDGPGYVYLRETCPENGFVVCRFLDRLPLQSDVFLWSNDLQKGVFGASDPNVRRALSREQYRFALAVIMHDPLAQTVASLRNAAKQEFLVKATEFDYTPDEKDAFSRKLPTSYLNVMHGTAAYTGRLPLLIWAATSYTSTAVAASILLWFAFSGRYRRARSDVPLMRLIGWVSFGVIANAAVCGVMSGPHDRYQARVAWLLPAMALIAHFQVYRSWWERRLRFEILGSTKESLPS